MRNALVRVTAIAFAVMALDLAPASAQFNPIQAAKDAYNKTKAQQQQQQAQRPAQQQAAAPPAEVASAQPAGSPPGSASQSASAPASATDCCSADAIKKYAASASFLDMVGIKLGMTPDQTIGAIRAYNPAMQVEVLNVRLEHPAGPSGNFVRTPLYVSAHTKQVPGSVYETISAEFTAPPNSPVLFLVQRSVTMPTAQAPRSSNLVDSFTKKYGTSNLQSPRGMAWVYDQSGKLLVRPSNDQIGCIGAANGIPVGTGQPNQDYGGMSLSTTAGNPGDGLTPACYSMNWIAASPLGDVRPDQPVTQMVAFMGSGALWVGGRQATHNWLQAEADAAKKKADQNAAQQTGPKL